MKKVAEKLTQIFALVTLEVIIVVAALIISACTFWVINNEVFLEKEEAFDTALFTKVETWHSPWFTTVMQAITFLSSKEFISFSCLCIFVYFFFIKKHPWYSIKIPIVALGCILLNLFLKYLYARPRPKLEHMAVVSGFSFPSGHAMMSFTFYGLLLFASWKNIRNFALRITVCLFLLVIIHLIGFSRVYLRVHYPSDVLAGFAVGTIWLVFSFFALGRVEKYFSLKTRASNKPGLSD